MESRVVSLRKRCVLEYHVFASPRHCDLRFRGGRFEVSCSGSTLALQYFGTSEIGVQRVGSWRADFMAGAVVYLGVHNSWQAQCFGDWRRF